MRNLYHRPRTRNLLPIAVSFNQSGAETGVDPRHELQDTPSFMGIRPI